MALTQALLNLALKGHQNVVAGLNQVGTALGNVGGQANKASSQTRALERAFFGLQSAIGALAIKHTFDQFVEAGLAMDRMERGLKAVTGSSEGAAREIAFLRAETQRLGVPLEASGTEFLKIAAAAKSSGLSMQDTRDTFTAVAEAAAVLGLSQEQVKGSLIALQQVISKGKVQTEELRRQLGDRIPGAFSIAAKAMGVTTGRLDEMLEKGEIFATDFIPRWNKALREEFAGGLEDALVSPQAALNRFSNAMFEFRNATFEGFAEELVRLNENWATTFQGMTKSAHFLGMEIAWILTGLTKLSGSTGEGRDDQGWIGFIARFREAAIRAREEMTLTEKAFQLAAGVGGVWMTKYWFDVERFWSESEKALNDFETTSADAAKRMTSLWDQTAKQGEISWGQVRKDVTAAISDMRLAGEESPENLKKVVAVLDQIFNAAKIMGQEVPESLQEMRWSLIAQIELMERAANGYGDGATAADALTRSIEDLTRKTFGSREAVEAQTKAFLGMVANMTEGIRVTDLTIAQQEALGKILQELLDAWEKVGEDPPAAIRKLAKELGVLSTTQEDAAKEAEKLAKEQEKAAEAAARHAEKVRDATRALRELQAEIARTNLKDAYGRPLDDPDTIEGDIADLTQRRQELETLMQQPVSLETLEEYHDVLRRLGDRTRDLTKSEEAMRLAMAGFEDVVGGVEAKIQDQLEKWHDLGVEPPAALQALARDYNVVLDASELTTQAIESQGQRIGESLAQQQSGVRELVQAFYDAEKSIADIAAGTREAFLATQGTEQLKPGSDAQKQDYEPIIKQTERLNAEIEALQTKENRTADETLLLGDKIRELHKISQETVVTTGDLGAEMDALTSPLVGAAEAGREMAEAAEKLKAPLSEAQTSISGLVEGTGLLVNSIDGAAPAITNIVGETQSLGEGLDEVGRATAEAAQAMNQQSEAVAGLNANQAAFNAEAGIVANAMKEVGDASAETGDKVEDAGEEVKASGEKMKEGTKDMTQGFDSAKKAAEGFEEVILRITNTHIPAFITACEKAKECADRLGE